MSKRKRSGYKVFAAIQATPSRIRYHFKQFVSAVDKAVEAYKELKNAR